MRAGIIGYNLSRLVIVAVICMALLVHLLREKRLFDYSKIRDPAWREKAMRYGRIINVVGFTLICVLFVAVLSMGVPIAKDVPYMVCGEYMTAEGPVLSDSLGGAAGRVQEREFRIKDDTTGEEIHLVALSTGIHEGEHVRVTYLPNSGLATINERR